MVQKRASIPKPFKPFFVIVIGLLISGVTPAFGVQGVVPYEKVLKDALNVATIHSTWVVAHGSDQFKTHLQQPIFIMSAAINKLNPNK